MNHSPRLALFLVLALLLSGLLSSLGEWRDARPIATERAQYKPAAVVPALGVRG